MKTNTDSPKPISTLLIEKWMSPRGVVVILVSYILSIVGYAIIVYAVNLNGRFPGVPASAGLFGDMFGAFNAFVSGLAMLGVVCALIIQQEQLSAQLKEMAKTAEAQEKSHIALVRSVDTQAFLAARAVLQNEEVRKARRVVMSTLKNRPFDEWIRDPDAVSTAEVVCHTFDTIGQMVKHKMLREEYIVGEWDRSIRETWSVLQPLIEHYRRDRQFGNYWDDFEYLASKVLAGTGRRDPQT